MIGAYIAIVLGVAVWAALVPTGKRLPDNVMRGITVFGGAFLLAVCFLDLVPEMTETGSVLPCVAVLVGFVVQQLLEGLSAHAEHGHVEGRTAIVGLMVGLSLHAFLEGMPLVYVDGVVNRGLLFGILIHNIPVALILVGVMLGKNFGFWRVLALLVLFGVMSPLGSLVNLYVVQPDEQMQHFIMGLVVGVLLHVSSSILFDHKQHDALWLNLGLCIAAFALAFLTVH